MSLSAVALLFWLCVLAEVHAFYGMSGRMPLKEGRRRQVVHRRPGCDLGGRFFEFEEKWSPLILPLGVMHCVKCECIPVIKKGVLHRKGRVSCRNIKTHCPKPDCGDPVLLPNRCCKSCPGELNSFEETFSVRRYDKMRNTISDAAPSSASSSSVFTALLVGQNMNVPVITRAVARAQFFIERSTLQFAISYTRLERPKFLQLRDKNYNIIYERPIEKSASGEKRVCGDWSKIPSIFITALKDGELTVVMTTAKYPNGVVSGRIIAETKTKQETFNSLLASSKKDGMGAGMMMTYKANGNTLKYEINHVGVFDFTASRREYFVTIERNNVIIHQSTGKYHGPGNKVTGTWSSMTQRQSKLLARGRLRIRLTSRTGTTVVGDITPRLDCGSYQSVLSSSDSLEGATTSSAGAAIFSINDNGALSYKIRLVGLRSEVTLVTLESAPNRRNKRRRIANITRKVRSDPNSSDVWIIGTYSKSKVIDIFLFLSGQLYVNVATKDHSVSEIRGRVIGLPYSKDIDRSDFPLLLSSLPEVPTSAAALAWFSVDRRCVLHYEILVSNVPVKSMDSLTAFLGGHDGYWYASTDYDRIRTRTLGGFVGGWARGEIDDLSEDLYKDLDNGNVVMEIKVHDHSSAKIYANVSLPNTCWQLARDFDIDMLVDDHRGEMKVEQKRMCNYDGKLYNEGETWLPSVHSQCNTCSCKHGKTVCDAVVCPVLNCTNPVKHANVCCHVCPSKNVTQEADAGSCIFDKREYPVGATWHPYIPPFGFVKCALCTCQGGINGTYTCSQTPCPALDCTTKDRIRINPDDCCQVCKVRQPTTPLPPAPQADKSMRGACQFGGQVFDNHAKWNPKVASFGSIKCVTCQCTDGEPTCERKKCRKLKCKRKIQRSGSCCPTCAGSRRKRVRSSKKILL